MGSPICQPTMLNDVSIACFTSPSFPCPFTENDVTHSWCCATWERRNKVKFVATGGLTLAGGMIAILGGCGWGTVAAIAGAAGNLASYLYTKETQEQIDLETTVHRLNQENEENKRQIALLTKQVELLTRPKLEEIKSA